MLRAETFTATDSVRHSSPHDLSWVSAWVSTQSVSESMMPGLLGGRQELIGEQQTAVWMVPPHQRLHRGDLPAAHAGLRLVVQHELVGADGPTQLTDERQLARVVAVVAGVVAHHRRRARLGDVERNVRVLQQRLDVGAVPRRHREPDARVQGERQPADFDLSLQQPEEALQRGPDVVTVRATGEHHAELVAAEAGDRVSPSYRCAQAVRQLTQQGVAIAVAERVVDLLEPVKVDDGHGYRAVALDSTERLEATTAGGTTSGSAARSARRARQGGRYEPPARAAGGSRTVRSRPATSTARGDQCRDHAIQQRPSPESTSRAIGAYGR